MTQASANVIPLRNGGLPAELAPLTEVEQWVIWRLVGETKPPYQAARSRRLAKTNNPSTWSDYATALRAYRRGEGDGRGFVLTDSGFAAFDLDKVRNPDTGALLPWAKKLIEACDSYAEVSPSGTGVHILGYGRGRNFKSKWDVPEGGKLERFRGKGYLTITGNVLHRAPLRNIDKQIDAQKKPPSGKDRSGSAVFHKRVLEMGRRGNTPDQIETYIRQNPDLFGAKKEDGKPGGARRFIEAGRLRDEIEYSLGIKPRPGAQQQEPADDWDFVSMDEVREQNVDYVWYPYLARKQLTVIEGDPDAKKSFLLAAVAAHLVDDGELPSERPRLQAEPGTVVLFDCENDTATVTKARLRHMGCKNQSLIKVHTEPFELSNYNVATLVEKLRQWNPLLVGFDTVNSYLERCRTERGLEVTKALQPFQQLARELNCSVAVLRHLTKNRETSALYRGQGNIAFVAKARIVVAVGVDEHDESKSSAALSRFAFGKKPPRALEFFVVDKRKAKDPDAFEFAWGDFVRKTADEVLQTTLNAPGRPPTARDYAETFLRDVLADGEMALSKLAAKAETKLISTSTLHRAARELGIIQRKEGRTRWWSLP